MGGILDKGLPGGTASTLAAEGEEDNAGGMSALTCGGSAIGGEWWLCFGCACFKNKENKAKFFDFYEMRMIILNLTPISTHRQSSTQPNTLTQPLAQTSLHTHSTHAYIHTPLSTPQVV